jgi:hypothetical protein
MKQIDSGDSAGEKRVYVDWQTLFSLEIPTGWFADTSKQQGTSVVLLHPSIEQEFRPNVNVMVHRKGALTLQEYLTLSRLQIKHLTDGINPSVDAAVAEPLSGHSLEWCAEFGQVPMKMLQRIVEGQDNFYVATATAPLARFEFYRGVFESVLNSLKTVVADQGPTAS